MKKILAILLCALLSILGTMTMAEAPYDDLFNALPGEPGSDAPPRSDGESADVIPLEINGESVQLTYDGSPQYSAIQGGSVQASYYAYSADGKTLYELYLSFPDTTRAGMVITPEYSSMTNEESSVMLIVSKNSVETYYFSSLLDGNVYPSGSGFTLSIDSVSEDGGMVSYAGTLSASLVAVDMGSGSVGDTLEIPATPFSFTISGQLSSPLTDAPQATKEPEDVKRA